MKIRSLPSASAEAWRRTPPATFAFVSSDSRVDDLFHCDTDLPAGVTITSETASPAAIPAEFDRLEKEPFSEFLIEEGAPLVTLRVAAGTRIETPLRTAVTLPAGGACTFARIVEIGEDASVTIIDRSGDGGGDQALVWEGYLLRPGSRLTIRRSLGPRRPWFLQAHAIVERDAHLRRLTTVEAATTLKHQQETLLTGEGAELFDYLIDRVDGSGHADVLIGVNHAAPRALSRIECRGVVVGRAYALHHGVTTIGKGQPGSDTYFTSRHLLLSDGARCDSIPKLLIDTDDVKAGHGATAGSLDPDALFYLMSRGLTLNEARTLLIEAFLTPVDGQFPKGTEDVA